MRIPKRHVFEFPFEIPASKTARSGRPRAKHVQHNNASEQLDHQLQIPQRETNVNPSASERAAYRAKRKNLGLCSDCSNQTEEGKRYCPSCSKIRDERIARLRNGRKDLGLCQDCGEPAISGLTRCSTYAERRRITMSRLRARRRLHGTCQNCSNEAIHEQNLCASCAVKQRARKTGTGKPSKTRRTANQKPKRSAPWRESPIPRSFRLKGTNPPADPPIPDYAAARTKISSDLCR